MPTNAIALLLILCQFALLAVQPVKASDNPYYQAVHCFNEQLNNPQAGDIAKCILTNNNQYMCPIGSVACQKISIPSSTSASCPSGYQHIWSTGQCRKAGTRTCRYDHRNNFWKEPGTLMGLLIKWGGQFVSGVAYSRGAYKYPAKGATGAEYAVCKTPYHYASLICYTGTYNPHTKRCDTTTYRNECPLGGQYACIQSGSQSYCSPNRCFNPQTDKENVDDDIDGGMLQDNGNTNEDGLCLDQVYIFNGRAQKCRPNGAQTGFKSCCSTNGEVVKDTSGASFETKMTMQGISAIYQATTAAYGAYAATAMFPAQQAQAVSSAFSNGMVGAFDPTSLAITLAVTLIMDYLAKACDPIETETAIANGSGRCVYLGTMCKEKWLGKCVQKQKSFCCYNSQLGAIINKQGRVQLKAFQNLPNGGFGDVKNPQCRGFTPEEFQALDFSNIDLSEYYEVLVHKSQSQMQDTMNKLTTEHFQNVQ